MGEEAAAIAEYNKQNPGAPKKKVEKGTFAFDNSGNIMNQRSAAQQEEDLQKELAARKAKGKISKQTRADGTRLAPWMVIDEDKVDAIKKKKDAERKARRQRGL